MQLQCRGITGRLTMQIYPDLPEVPIF